MKKTYAIILMLLGLCSYSWGQATTFDSIVDMLTYNLYWRGGAMIPITVCCDTGAFTIVGGSGQLYSSYTIRHNVSEEEFLTLLRGALKNNDTLEYCMEDIEDFFREPIPRTPIRRLWIRPKIVYYYASLGKEEFLKWAFDEDHNFKLAKGYLPAVVEQLLKWNILVRIGCESHAYFYSEFTKSDYEISTSFKR